MKLLLSTTLLCILCSLNTACVSRTTSSEKSFGNDVSETKLIWIWQDEYRNSK